MNETCPHCGAQIYDPFGGSTRIHDVFECGRNKSVATAIPATEETDEIYDALGRLLFEIPKETEDCDWMSDGLKEAVKNANKVMRSQLSVKSTGGLEQALRQILAYTSSYEFPEDIDPVTIRNIAKNALAGASSQKEEIERLKGLIEKAFNTAMNNFDQPNLRGNRHFGVLWNEFKTENNL